MPRLRSSASLNPPVGGVPTSRGSFEDLAAAPMVACTGAEEAVSAEGFTVDSMPDAICMRVSSMFAEPACSAAPATVLPPCVGSGLGLAVDSLFPFHGQGGDVCDVSGKDVAEAGHTSTLASPLALGAMAGPSSFETGAISIMAPSPLLMDSNLERADIGPFS